MEFRPPSFFALAALIEGPLHGYAIMKRARDLSGQSVRLSTGTLYSVLERAMAKGLVTAGQPYLVSGRERRDYTLTPHGHVVLEQEVGRLESAAKVVRTSFRTAAAGGAR